MPVMKITIPWYRCSRINAQEHFLAFPYSVVQSQEFPVMLKASLTFLASVKVLKKTCFFYLIQEPRSEICGLNWPSWVGEDIVNLETIISWLSFTSFLQMPIFGQILCLVGFASPHLTTDDKGVLDDQEPKNNFSRKDLLR